MGFSNSPLFAANTESWSELDNRLNTLQDSVAGLIQIVQNPWYIPLAIAFIIIAVLIVAGGKNGRIEAKSALWWVLVGSFIIFMIPSLAALIVTLSGGTGDASQLK